MILLNLLKSNKIIFINSKVARFNKSKNSFGEKNHKIGIKETKIIKTVFRKIKNISLLNFIYDRLCNYLINFKNMIIKYIK